MKERKSSTVINVTKSEARRQEKLRRRRERDRQRRAEEIAEQREEREIEQVGNHVLPSRPERNIHIKFPIIQIFYSRNIFQLFIIITITNYSSFSTDYSSIIPAKNHFQFLFPNILLRPSPDPGVRVLPRESLIPSCVDDQLCPDPGVRVSPG